MIARGVLHRESLQVHATRMRDLKTIHKNLPGIDSSIGTMYRGDSATFRYYV